MGSQLLVVTSIGLVAIGRFHKCTIERCWSTYAATAELVPKASMRPWIAAQVAEADECDEAIEDGAITEELAVARGPVRSLEFLLPQSGK